MEDFKFITEVKVTVIPVTPKTGIEQRGPYERNKSIVVEKGVSTYYGDKGDVATLAANALKTITRQWGLLASEPATGYVTAATPVADVTATLNGKAHDHGTSTVVTFEYGTTMALGTSTAAAESPLTGDALQAVSLDISSLTAETQYYFRLKMVSGGITVYTTVGTFVTSA
jgi:hypothetical protein